MTWLHKQLRPLLFVLGGLLVIGSLLGARLLTAGGGGGTDATPAPPPASKTALGTIVQGYVDSDPPPVYTGLPPVLQSGEVVQVFVKAGDEVKVRPVTIFGKRVELGDRLYKFNTQMLDAKLAEAEDAVAVARANVRKARALQDQHQTNIKVQKEKLDTVKTKMELSKEGLEVYEKNLWETLSTTQTVEKAKERYAADPERFRLKKEYITSVKEHSAEKLALDVLQEADVGAAVAIAEAEVKRAEAMLNEAKTAVDLCTVRAKVNGTVEQVNVSAGTVMGVSTRTPAVVLVPSGRRVVRAEVEAEFAHRIGTDKIGKKVTIYDNTDPKLTYEGTVERIGDTFLPKRGAGDGLIQSDTRVLEALVVVSDPAPAGKPPLRVGQKVRVNFGQ